MQTFQHCFNEQMIKEYDLISGPRQSTPGNAARNVFPSVMMSIKAYIALFQTYPHVPLEALGFHVDYEIAHFVKFMSKNDTTTRNKDPIAPRLVKGKSYDKLEVSKINHVSTYMDCWPMQSTIPVHFIPSMPATLPKQTEKQAEEAIFNHLFKS